jgi:glycosyltransferase involved in cell wall biosynthesis
VRILVLSFYFRPDLSAGSFRTTALVAALRAQVPEGARIDVVTTLPNRYSTFSSAAPEHETEGNVEITRIGLPAHRSDMLGQARAFLRFARAAARITHGTRYDLVYATSSRLMTAVLGARLARRARASLYLDIRDIFVETIADVLHRAAAPLMRLAFSGLERWAIGSATRVNLVSRGFAPYFAARYPGRDFSWFTNGIDDEFITPPAAPAAAAAAVAVAVAQAADPRPLILYAGNLGESQALHHVLPQLARALEPRARFVVIGDGGRRTQLESALAAAGTTNVELRKPMTRAALIDAYRSADVLFLHLGNQPAFEKVLPSKLFEYGALGKPVLAGVGGFAARFVSEEIRNAAVFGPCDAAAAVRAFESLTLRDTPRPEFIEKFHRANIARDMAREIVALARSGAGRG